MLKLIVSLFVLLVQTVVGACCYTKYVKSEFPMFQQTRQRIFRPNYLLSFSSEEGSSILELKRGDEGGGEGKGGGRGEGKGGRVRQEERMTASEPTEHLPSAVFLQSSQPEQAAWERRGCM